MDCTHSHLRLQHSFPSKIISYPLFADADREIYPPTESQNHLRLKPKCGIAKLSVDKFLHLWKQTRGNEFIPCWNDVCHILRHNHSFKIPAIPLIWPKSSYKHSVARSHCSGEESGMRSESPLWGHQWHSFFHISCWWCQTWDTCLNFMVVKQSEVRFSNGHGTNPNIITISSFVAPCSHALSCFWAYTITNTLQVLS